MQIWIWACAVVAASVLGGCLCSSERQERTTVAAVTDGSFYTERLPGLEQAMAQVATKRAWSGHYFRDATVTGAMVQDTDLFVSLFNANTRRHEVHCLNATRGDLRWMVDLGESGLKFPPGANDRFVVFLTENGGMTVVSRTNGSREFRWMTPLRVIPAAAAGSSESTVYLVSLADNRLHAINPDTGMSGWNWRSMDSISCGPIMTPRLPRRLVVLTSEIGEVLAFPAAAWNDLGPGVPSWSRKLLGEISACPVIAEIVGPTGHDVSVIVPCEDNGLYCLDGATGDARWVVRTAHPFRMEAQVAGGRVFGRNEARLIVADLATGAQPWNPSNEGEPLKPWEMCVGVHSADDRRTYLDCGDRRVSRADSKSGEILATATLSVFDWIIPAAKPNVLLGVTSDGHLVAFQ